MGIVLSRRLSKLIPDAPIVVRTDLPTSLRQAIQESLATMKSRAPQAFEHGGAFLGGFVKTDDSRYQIIRDLNETTKKLASQQKS
jgi:ABC-type phosphate/phosphonate transport system substrate-binding protein